MMVELEHGPPPRCIVPTIYRWLYNNPNEYMRAQTTVKLLEMWETFNDKDFRKDSRKNSYFMFIDLIANFDFVDL